MQRLPDHASGRWKAGVAIGRYLHLREVQVTGGESPSEGAAERLERALALTLCEAQREQLPEAATCWGRMGANCRRVARVSACDH